MISLPIFAVLALFMAIAPVSATPGRVTPAPIACDPTQGGCWHPDVDSRWQYQLQGVSRFASTGGINTTISAVPFTGGAAVRPVVFDFDLYTDESIAGNNTTLNTAPVDAVHARGARAICYISAGTWENWRADEDQFPTSVRGAKNGWPGERWLDIRKTSILLPIMQARIAKCQSAGFDGIEFDNVDGYSNHSGFPLSAQDQLVYNESLANLAHEYGLTAALKNDIEQVPTLASYYDYAINEQCQQYNECGNYNSYFTAAGKAVFQVEYELAPAKFCTKANDANRSAILKNYDLFDKPYTPCR